MADPMKRKQVLSAAALYFLEAGKYEKVIVVVKQAAQCYKRLTHDDD